jgi:C1A family cysteine protease
MKAVLFLCAIVAVSAIPVLKESEYQFLFTRFVAEHNKKYDTNEFFARFSIFKTNVDYIRNENKKNNSYELGMNQFGDLTANEFKTQIVGGCFQGVSASSEPQALRGSAPQDVDWGPNGQKKVQVVKNQGQCGSCWAFSAIGALESAWAIAKGGDVPNNSEQQLVDCAGSEGNQGCNGGLMNQAFDYLIKFGGSQPTSSYPYTARDGQCKADKSKVSVTIGSHKELPANEDALGDALQKGPVSVAIEADQSIFQFYKSGILDGNCGRNLDHGVLAIGYKNDAQKGYWIVKNSWGTSWGNQGYVWIRAFKNMCGITGNGWNSQPAI